MLVLPLRRAPAPAVVVRHSRASRRLRLDVPALRWNERLARHLEAELRERSGVVGVRADTSSGRILVSYAPGSPLPRRIREMEDEVRKGARNPRRRRAGGTGRAVALAGAAFLPVTEVARRLRTGARGLTDDEAERTLAEVGPNLIAEVRSRSSLELLLAQVVNLPAALLLGSSGLSVLVGDVLDALGILAAVGLNTGIGYRIERKTEDLVASWRRLEAGEARVVRGGTLRTVPAAGLVPGDLVLVRAGDTVPADARVHDAHRLACDEAILTGESEPAAKTGEACAPGAALAERRSMLYAGTVVSGGHGRAFVTATGPATESARIRLLLESQAAPATPLEERLDDLGRHLSMLGIGSGLAASGVSVLRGVPGLAAARSAVALAVAAIPEGLPVVSTAALVRSMQRMRERGMVVRRIASAETLGGVTVVCADKTGTLTRNAMAVDVLEVGGRTVDLEALRCRSDRIFEHEEALALAAAVLNDDVDVLSNGSNGRRGKDVAGSSTERALVEAAEHTGLSLARLRRLYPRRVLRERSAAARYVVSLHDTPEGARLAFTKGAPEQVVALCTRDTRGPLGPAERQALLARNDALAGRGLRVLALAWRRARRSARRPPGGGYTFLGLVGLRDPLRPGAREAVRLAARAGIRTVIVTGDQRRTAEAIARAVGLEGESVDGPQVRALLEDPRPEARQKLRETSVFSRVSPEDKVGIVKALRASGEIVAMAGDGLNDAPALKAADIGIAIGLHSSDVSRQAADVILENEDLQSILAGVGEGRITQDNLRRAIRFLVSTNLSEVLLVLAAGILGRPDPFRPAQLLWLNLLSDSLPALALALEPGDPDVLDRRPAPPGAPLLPRGDVRGAVRDAITMAALGGVGLLGGGPPAALSSLAGAELGYALACRAPNGPATYRFTGLLAAATALQGLAFAVRPLRTLLGLPGLATAPELAAFVLGVLMPLLLKAGDGDLIVRRGPAAGVRAREPRVARASRLVHAPGGA